MKQLLQVLFTLAIPLAVWSQPTNDECSAAIEIEDVMNWCSASSAFNNNAATESTQGSGSCLLTGDSGMDVWFSFLAQGTDVSVRVIGNASMMPGGTLTNPELVVYGGSCDQLTEIGCNSDAFSAGVVELLLSDLTPGARYFLRISGRNDVTGTFQICLNSFNTVPDPNSDCPTGVVLCDKSSFVVEALSGTGEIRDEASGSCLGQNSANSESGSAWYKWVAADNGTLTFTLTPNNPSDDLDFALYELPNGLNDCSDKILLRCMASGEQGGCPTAVWEPCTGPTGLRSSSTDVQEFPGCNVNNSCVFNFSGQDDDNFIAAADLEAGKVYALIVNNFTQSGSGFSIEFGGTAEFLGPQADFMTDDLDGTVCFGEPVTFFDQSSFGNLSLTEWQWNFGEGAIPQVATGPGPHQVTYNEGGIKSVALTVESETGCLVTEIGSLIVENPFEVQADITDQSCPESIDGRIALDINSGSNVTSILWDNGQSGNILENLEPGSYEVTIVNFNGCDTVIPYAVESPMPLDIDNIITRPSCGGGADGSITLNVEGQAPPFQFDFGGGFTTSNTATNLAADIYNISIQDNNGCITDLSVELGEINVELDPNFDPVQPPSCFGFNDGQVEIRIVGGDRPYALFYNGQIRMESDNIFRGLSAGLFDLTVRDGANCLGFS